MDQKSTNQMHFETHTPITEVLRNESSSTLNRKHYLNALWDIYDTIKQNFPDTVKASGQPWTVKNCRPVKSSIKEQVINDKPHIFKYFFITSIPHYTWTLPQFPTYLLQIYSQLI